MLEIRGQESLLFLYDGILLVFRGALKRNPVLSRLGDLSLPNHEDENLTILPHSSYSETVYQAKSWD
ncbi:hypothetical protein, partial [Streptococcus danieliae]|uniref:hypothetical protein n=1 Tax=Streptococcus danieliae TaxID=747656 RepID=UPI001C54E417